MPSPRLKLLKTSALGSDLVSDVEKIVIRDDGSGNPVTEYTLPYEYINPVVYLIRSGSTTLLPSSAYTAVVETGSTRFTFNNVQIGDTIIIHSSGNVLAPSMFVTGDPSENFTRVDSFYIYADGANFINISVTVEDLASNELAKTSWISLSLDQSNWSNTISIPSLSNGSLTRVYFRITIPSSDRNNLPIGIMPDLAISVTGVAVI